jgi:hypothetical protein
MADYKILEVRYEIDAHNNPSPRFTVPEPVRKVLDISASDDLWVEVSSPVKGVTRKMTRLKSGPEIYGDGLQDCCDPGERICVRVSKA